MSKPRNPAHNRTTMNPDMLTKRLRVEKTRDLISLPTYGAGAVKGKVRGVGDSVSGKRDHLNRHTTEKWEGLGKVRNPVLDGRGGGVKIKRSIKRNGKRSKGRRSKGFSKESQTIARRTIRWPKHFRCAPLTIAAKQTDQFDIWQGITYQKCNATQIWIYKFSSTPYLYLTKMSIWGFCYNCVSWWMFQEKVNE